MKTKLLSTIFLMLAICFVAQAQTPVMHYTFDNNLNNSGSVSQTLSAQGGFVAAYEADNEGAASSALTYAGGSNHALQSTYTGISGTSARTVTAWIKTTSNNPQAIVSWGTDAGGTLFEVMTKSGELRLKIGNATSTTAFIKKTVNNIVNGGEWHHIAVTVPADGALNDCVLYVDGGVAAINTTASGATAVNTTISTGVTIGNSIISDNYFRNGAIDDVRIYASELTAGEILAVAGIAVSAPVANFTGATTATVGEIVTFTDASTETPTSWAWDFGDISAVGNKTVQNPQIAFRTPGTYSVTLTASNAGGSDDEVKVNYITVSAGTGSGDLQAQYNFDGDVTDASSYGRDLVAQGTFVPSYETDHLSAASSALTASGVQANHLLTGYSGIGADGSRTVTAWFKTTGTSREPIVSWGKDGAGTMFNVMIANGVPRVEGGQSSLITADTGLNNNAWHHIAVTFDPNDGNKLANCKIYIDGVLSTNLADGAGLSYQSDIKVLATDDTTNFLKIGSAVYSTYTFHGAIDDVRIYSKELTSGEITTVMNGGVLGVKDIAFGVDELKIYPSVVSDFLTIRTIENQGLDINIYNILGRMVNKTSSNESSLKIDMSSLSSGLYIVKVRVGNKVSSIKIIKD